MFTTTVTTILKLLKCMQWTIIKTDSCNQLSICMMYISPPDL